MKNLLFAAALSLGTLTAFAQDNESNNAQQTATEVTATAQDGFNEITKKDIPSAVKDALKKDQPDGKISKAFVNGDGQYKLEVTKKDGTTSEIYADSEGNWIDM